MDTNPPPQSDILVECPICGRKFAKDRIQRHMEVHEPSILPSEHVHVETGLLLREFIQPEVRYKSVKILSGVQGSAG